MAKSNSKVDFLQPTIFFSFFGILLSFPFALSNPYGSSCWLPLSFGGDEEAEVGDRTGREGDRESQRDKKESEKQTAKNGHMYVRLYV